MEFIYACVHFVSIVFVYQLVLHLQLGTPASWMLLNTVIFAMFFFGSGAFFILLLYPGSLQDKTWLQVRGAVLGAVLHVTLLWGMLL
jgi:hypothetical protein